MLLFSSQLASAFFEVNQGRRFTPGTGSTVSFCEIKGGRRFAFCSRRTFMLVLFSHTMSRDSSLDHFMCMSVAGLNEKNIAGK